MAPNLQMIIISVYVQFRQWKLDNFIFSPTFIPWGVIDEEKLSLVLDNGLAPNRREIIM